MEHIRIKQNRLTRRYRVVTMGGNNEVLSVSESLNSTQAVAKNVAAQAKVWEHPLDIRWDR